jgi:hypothetical protein
MGGPEEAGDIGGMEEERQVTGDEVGAGRRRRRSARKRAGSRRHVDREEAGGGGAVEAEADDCSKAQRGRRACPCGPLISMGKIVFSQPDQHR